MTYKQYADLVHFYTGTDSTTFSDANVLLLSNVFIDDFAKRILRVNEDYFGMVDTTDLVANQREYPFPSDMLPQIKKVEAKLDGSNWIDIKELDLNSNVRTTDETSIVSMYSNSEGNCFYDIFRGSLWLYSGAVIDVTGGLKLWRMLYPQHISDLTSATEMSIPSDDTSRPFPKEFHELLARRLSIAYKTTADRPVQLSENENKFEYDFQVALESVSNINLDRTILAKLPDSSTRGDAGWNY